MIASCQEIFAGYAEDDHVLMKWLGWHAGAPQLPGSCSAVHGQPGCRRQGKVAYSNGCVQKQVQVGGVRIVVWCVDDTPEALRSVACRQGLGTTAF